MFIRVVFFTRALVNNNSLMSSELRTCLFVNCRYRMFYIIFLWLKPARALDVFASDKLSRDNENNT